jgi:hypothetical protein
MNYNEIKIEILDIINYLKTTNSILNRRSTRVLINYQMKLNKRQIHKKFTAFITLH